jgi:urease accessory protein
MKGLNCPFFNKDAKMEPVTMKDGWKGFLSFSFVDRDGLTVVKDKQHFGPLVIQRPYYQEKNRPSILVLHPPGGVVGGDQLELHVNFKSNSKGMVSTPAATKFYRSENRLASQNQIIHLSEGSEAEWLPQETLFFNHAKVKNTLKFELDGSDCKLIAWDIVGLGRPASGEGFEFGELSQTLELWLAGKLIFLDRLRLMPNQRVINSSAGLDGNTLFASMLLYSSESILQKKLLEALQSMEWTLSVGVTLLDNLIVLRFLANDLDEIKSALFSAWVVARPVILGVPVVRPRIWNT